MKKQLLLFILAVLAVTVFCFWLFLYPFIPIVREMSQLFLWTEDYFVERIMIPEGGELHANGSYADFDVDEWHQLLQANKGGQLTFTVCAEKDGQWTQYRDFQVFVSNEEMDAWGQTGETHPIDEVNSSRTESLHNWTPNSHWFLFTSRRDDGLYTRIYFSSLDSNGKATKPFLLPQRNPKEYYCQSLYSYNTPDFSIRPITPHGHELGRQIESDKRVETQIIRK